MRRVVIDMQNALLQMRLPKPCAGLIPILIR